MAGIAEARELRAMAQRRAEAKQNLRQAILRSAADGLSYAVIAVRCGTSKKMVERVLRAEGRAAP